MAQDVLLNGVRRRRGMLARPIPRSFLRSPLALASVVAVAAWLALAAAAPLIAPYGPLAQDIADRLAPPSPQHWFGTDPLGRDILSRVLYGAQLSIPVGLIAVALAVVLGTLIGSLAGVAGGLVDEAIMRLTDLMLAFPTVILAMIISAALGAGIRNAVIAIMVAWWPTYARFARGLVIGARDREYVEAARAVGASPLRVFVRHVLLNILSPIVILGTLDVGRAILTFASLSFLGLGPPPQIPEWGSEIAAGRDYLDQWWIATFPGLAILTLVVALNVVGDGLRDALDPRLRET
ncbi:MAG TPA: ABC transporter permease [bacterium]|nr:ABC transporter permease [bacterium]